MQARTRLCALALGIATALVAAGSGGASDGSRPGLAPAMPAGQARSEVREEAEKLASDWVRTASQANLNDFAYRTAAFAGMVHDTTVVLDGHTMAADRTLMDSANTILGPHTAEEDAQAVRNITYTLDLVASGRAERTKR